MRGARYFRWAARPQLLVGFVTICLCIGALGSVARPSPQPPAPETAASQARVKGLGSTFLPAPNCGATPCLALTFDDGPSSVVTPRILDILARQQAKATFFVVGKRIEGRGHILKRAYSEGHEVGNHSWDHTSFTKLSPSAIETQLRMTQQAIMTAGVPAPHVFRAPYGAVDGAVMGHMDMTVARWNIDPEDWRFKDAQIVKDNLIAQAKPGGIVLLHDTNASTADALEPALQALKPHYQFVTVSQLLNISPGDRGYYSGR